MDEHHRRPRNQHWREKHCRILDTGIRLRLAEWLQYHCGGLPDLILQAGVSRLLRASGCSVNADS